MTKRFKILSVLCLTFVITGLFTIDLSSPSSALALSEGLSPRLSLTASASKIRHRFTEPISLVAILKNEVSTPIRWKGGFGSGQNISFFSRDGSGRERQINGSYYGLMKLREVDTAPGEQRRQEMLLNNREIEVLMPNSGRYEVRISFGYFEGSSGQQTVVMSDPFIIEIAESSLIEREAHQFLIGEMHQVLMSGNVSRQIEVRRLFSTRFRSTAYYPFNALELANLLTKEGDFVNAENELYEISDIDFYYSSQVEIQLKSLGRQLGQVTPRTKRPRVQANVPNPTGWIERPDIRPNYNIAPIPAPVLVPNPTATPRIQ